MVNQRVHAFPRPGRCGLLHGRRIPDQFLDSLLRLRRVADDVVGALQSPDSLRETFVPRFAEQLGGLLQLLRCFGNLAQCRRNRELLRQLAVPRHDRRLLELLRQLAVPRHHRRLLELLRHLGRGQLELPRHLGGLVHDRRPLELPRHLGGLVHDRRPLELSHHLAVSIRLCPEPIELRRLHVKSVS